MKEENSLLMVWSITDGKAGIVLLNAACPKVQIETRKLIQYRLSKRKIRSKKVRRFTWRV